MKDTQDAPASPLDQLTAQLTTMVQTGDVEALAGYLDHREGILAIERGAKLAPIGPWLLHLAIRKDQPDMIRLLVGRGVDVNGFAAGERKPFPVARATNVRRMDCLKVLLSLGGDPNVQTPQVDAPIIIAAAHEEPDYAQVLIDHGARLDVTSVWWYLDEDSAGHFPLDIAIKRRRVETSRVLLDAGAPISVERIKDLLWLCFDHDSIALARSIVERGYGADLEEVVKRGANLRRFFASSAIPEVQAN